MQNKAELRKKIKARKENNLQVHDLTITISKKNREELDKCLREEIVDRKLKTSEQTWKPEHKK